MDLPCNTTSKKIYINSLARAQFSNETRKRAPHSFTEKRAQGYFSNETGALEHGKASTRLFLERNGRTRAGDFLRSTFVASRLRTSCTSLGVVSVLAAHKWETGTKRELLVLLVCRSHDVYLPLTFYVLSSCVDKLA
jgi:hypothetical protein